MRTPETAPKRLETCEQPAVAACRTLGFGILVPALLWGVLVIGVHALVPQLIEGAYFPDSVVALAFAGALLTAGTYRLCVKERQSDEASLRAASALWCSLLVAAVVDAGNLAPGAYEGALVSLIAIAVLFALWAPYLWKRRATLPHATAWTLAAVSALPYGLGMLLESTLDVQYAEWLPQAGAVLSALAGLATSAFAARSLPTSARLVVQAAAVCLLGFAWLETAPNAWVSALEVPMAGALLALFLLTVERSGWRTILHGRGLGLILLCAAVGAGFTLAHDAFVLAILFGSAVALLAWWRVVVRRCGPDLAAQSAAVRVAATRLRWAVAGSAMVATVSLWGALANGLALDRSSGEILAWFRAAGVSDIDESDIAGAILRDEYLWSGQVVARTEPSEYTGPFGRWGLPERDRWSHADGSERARRREREQALGTGLVIADDGPTTTVLVVQEGSPAHALGIRRGDRILREPGGHAQPGPRAIYAIDFPVTFTIAASDGTERIVEIPVRELRQGRVARTATMEIQGRPVGYVMLQRFDNRAEREFADAIASLRSKGVRTLVVDLRYNPGGRLSSAAEIAGAILGDRGRGRVFATTHHNPRYRDRDRVVRFAPRREGGLEADQVVVITSAETCSASELLIKGLEPHLPVATVGGTTCGKPVGSLRLDSGGLSYAVISLAVRNAKGEGEYFDGLPPTCVATDDVAHELGDPAEASLREALHYISTGRCTAGPAGTVDDAGAML